MEEFLESHGNTVDDEHCFSSIDRRPVEEDYTGFRGHIASMYHRSQGYLGGTFALVEFTYNNRYQVRIQMAPYEALYERSCRSPIYWTEVGEGSITGLDLIRDTSEKVDSIQKRLLTS